MRSLRALHLLLADALNGEAKGGLLAGDEFFPGAVPVACAVSGEASRRSLAAARKKEG